MSYYCGAMLQYPRLEVIFLINKVQDDQNLIADYSNALTLSDHDQLDSYSSSSIGWDPTSGHSDQDLILHHDQASFVQDTTFDLAAQGSYEYLFNTGYCYLHNDSVCGVGIPYEEVGGSIPPMDPQLDVNQHFPRPVVHDSKSSQAASARFDPVGVCAQNSSNLNKYSHPC